MIKDFKNNNEINKAYKLKNRMIFIGLILIIMKIRAYEFYHRINGNLANITLIIKGEGEKNIFFGNFDRNYYPKKIIINTIEQDEIQKSYVFEEEINTVELIWENNDIYSCRDMFRDNSYLTEIDMSNFDMTHVTSMWCMLKQCYYLTSINLSNLNTSNVKEMNGLFHGCNSLTSINLSNFDTSQVYTIEYIFSDCYSLEYINIQNFNDIKFQKFDKFFKSVPDNVVICVNKNNINSILDQLENKCYNISCSDVWRPNQKKLISINNTCVDDCSNTEYKYEFNGKCYKDCENNINNQIIDICHYYFDYNDNTYKECFKTCKTCKIFSNKTDHNCDECKDGFKFFNDSSHKSKNCYPNCDDYYYINETDKYTCINSCIGNYNKVISEKKKCIENCIMMIYIYTIIMILV